MSKPQPRLGRGLSAILGPPSAGSPPRTGDPPARDVAPMITAASPGAGPGVTVSATAGGAGLTELPLASIVPNRGQPRALFSQESLQSLAESIRAQGILQPILVRAAGADGTHEILAGERRWRAATLAGLERVPVIIREASSAEALEIALVENLQREDLTPLERATAYRTYVESFHVTVDQLAERLGESRSNTSNYLRLLSLHQEIQDMLTAGQIAMGQARAIAGIHDPQRQLGLARLAVRRNLSVRQVEQLARGDDRFQPTAATSERASNRRHLSDVERGLSQAMGLPVIVVPGRRKNSGRVMIRYNSLEEFDRIAERLGGSAVLE
jgi:ParB family chromosome partitioning protein